MAKKEEDVCIISVAPSISWLNGREAHEEFQSATRF